MYAQSSVFCEVLGVESKRIQCTFFTQRVPFDRNVSFHWKSPDAAYDFRQHDFTLPAHHASVYDYRYYHGRSLGIWNITVKDDANKTLAQTSFELQSDGEEPK